MPDNLYTDDAEEMESAPASPDEAPESEDKPTFLMPKAAFQGREVEVGDTEQVKITRDLGEQYEAVCISDYDEEEEKEEAPAETEAPVGDAGMRALME